MADKQYQVGDEVIFTDEFGKEQTGTIVNTETWGTKGLPGIDSGSYGVYSRFPEEVRLVKEVTPQK